NTPGIARPCGRSLTLGFRKLSLFETCLNVFSPNTAAHSAQVSRVCDPHGMWCPVEDTDLPLRMACFSLSHFFRRGRAAAVENEGKKGVFLDNFN
ncbi:MAG: hypothetical protein K2I38_03400, partial [Duncaniella sp.]|nr:hypothetical protein [Duncaniella sp.]